jgi:sugar phosphate isomerase/epimerase
MKSQNRREFLKFATMGAVGAAALGQIDLKANTLSAGKPGIGLQLYTIRDAMKADPAGSLKKVADIGFKYLELAGFGDGKFYGYTPEDFKKLVADLGMEAVSSHSGVEVKGVDTSNAEAMAEAHAKLGVKYCIQPWLVEERRKSVDSYKKFVADLNVVGGVMQKYGIQFGYHNHDFEFKPVEGKVPYFDIYMVDADPKLVVFEMDCYWVTRAGQNPIDIFKKYPGRFHLLHFKDMEKTPDKFFAPVGTGSIDYKAIYDARAISGMKYIIVEQDNTRDGKPFDAIKISFDNISNKILV